MKPSSLLKFEYLKSNLPTTGPFQSHDNYEIFYFHEGKGNYLIGHQIYSLAPGTLILMHGMTLHCPCSFDGFPYVRTLVNFDQLCIRNALWNLMSINALEPFERFGNYVVQLNEEEQQEFEVILERIHRFHSEQSEVAYERFRLAFIDALLFIHSILQKPLRKQAALPPGKERHIQNALNYIEHHYTDQLSLEQLDDALHINKYHLARLFREVTGMTIFQYVIQRRLNQAKLLFLLEPHRSATDICYLAGFKNVSHFSKSFKQHEGRTPEQYRREMRS
jgi:AraC-like DNA-binding protein